MQAEEPRRNAPVGFYSDVMDGQDSALIFKGKQQRTSGRGLQPGAVVVRGVVVADGGVVATGREAEVVVVGIREQVTFYVDAEGVGSASGLAVDVVGPGFEDNFAKELEFVGDVGGDE